LEDAHRLGIEDGERVLVESSVAKVELHALVRTGIVAGALGLPLGGGPTARETSPSAASLLLGPTSTPVPGQAWPQITRAQIGKLS
jgi:anaerobic selenocysteine-containing dehydrogenase